MKYYFEVKLLFLFYYMNTNFEFACGTNFDVVWLIMCWRNFFKIKDHFSKKQGLYLVTKTIGTAFFLIFSLVYESIYYFCRKSVFHKRKQYINVWNILLPTWVWNLKNTLLYSLNTNIAQVVHSPLIMPLETGELWAFCLCRYWKLLVHQKSV